MEEEKVEALIDLEKDSNYEDLSNEIVDTKSREDYEKWLEKVRIKMSPAILSRLDWYSKYGTRKDKTRADATKALAGIIVPLKSDVEIRVKSPVEIFLELKQKGDGKTPVK